MDILLGYLAGLLTIINPCILPVIPLTLASAASSGPRGPVALAAGMSLSFTVLGVATAAIGPAAGLSPEAISQVGALMMVAFGLVLLVPRFNLAFSTAAAGVANYATRESARWSGDGNLAQFGGGALLGAVWSPCIGPTLGGAIALASQQASLGWATAIMLAFSLGVSTIILALSYGTREALGARRQNLRELSAWSKPIMGVVFVAVGVSLFLGLHHRVEAALVGAMPAWLQDLSVSI
jgi:cytochrome c biogenesis protein CcdA